MNARMDRDLFAFVILHYCAMQETLNCITSIEKYCKDKYIIVVVDNGSPNGTGEKLKEICANKANCSVILSEQNLGFARGNNVGFRYAKQVGARFICMMNSDTCLVDDSFTKQIKKDYKEFGYYVLGPNIILNQPEIRVNPLGTHVFGKREVKRKIMSVVFQIILVKLRMDKVLDFIRNRKRSNNKNNVYKRDEYYKNVKLHGCCLVLSPDYIKQYDGLNETTFLYLEEDMLFLEMQRASHLMLYSPNVYIYHAEDASTNYIKQGRKKRLFILQNHLKSLIAIEKRICELDKE